jgi:hypothetical protein
VGWYDWAPEAGNLAGESARIRLPIGDFQAAAASCLKGNIGGAAGQHVSDSVADYDRPAADHSTACDLQQAASRIDRSLVREVTRDNDDRAIADFDHSMRQSAQSPHRSRGCGDGEQEAFLRAHNCDEVQGYLISKPVPPDEFAAFLATQNFAELKGKVG